MIETIFELLKNIKIKLLKGLSVLIQHGPSEFMRRLKKKIAMRLLSGQPQTPDIGNTVPASLTDNAPGNGIFVRQLLHDRFVNIQPIRYVKINRQEVRLNIVTDSIKKHSLFGGVATSLILATLYANRYNVPLRIITRTTYNNPKDYFEFLEFSRIVRPRRVEFYSDYDRNTPNNRYKLEVSEKDVFLSTSWWTSEAVKTTNLRGTFFYILQEVESFFYPNGDDQFLCQNILNDQCINYIINSKLLYEYYDQGNFKNVTNKGIYFEPAFPEHIYYPGENTFSKKTKYSLLFYSRPNNPRNLYYSGLKYLDQALLNGIIDRNEWDIYFAGAEIPAMSFSNGVVPAMLGHMDWNKYAQFLKTVDLGFCLMYTPHPSYPPLDIASSGGVVLTNKYKNKQSLAYSDNIICRNMDIEAMIEGFSQGVELARDMKRRKENFLRNRINRRWEDSFEEILQFMHDKL